MIFLFDGFILTIEQRCYEDRDFRLFCSLLHFQHLKQYLEGQQVLNKYLSNEIMHFQKVHLSSRQEEERGSREMGDV